MVLLSSNTLYGANRSEQQMKQAALKVLNDNIYKPSNRVKRNSSSIKELNRMSKLAIYGFEDEGFAVIANDDRFTEVIGYSKTRYTDNNMPCGFNWWLETINTAMQQEIEEEPFSLKAKTAIKASVQPLLATKWGQGTPYNNYCVAVANGEEHKCVTGCIATAMAQVMKYHNFPHKGKGSVSYTINYNSWGEVFFSSNFSEHEYDWDNMISRYNYGYTGEQANAVATLMYDCGVSVGMGYGVNESVASHTSVPYALKEFFSYL